MDPNRREVFVFNIASTRPDGRNQPPGGTTVPKPSLGGAP